MRDIICSGGAVARVPGYISFAVSLDEWRVLWYNGHAKARWLSMKYMTKEWYQTMQKTSFHLLLHVTKQAEQFSEGFYRALYEAKENEMVRLWEEVSKIQLEEPLPHDPETCDPDATRRTFKKNHRANVKYLKDTLPENILQQVADIRVLALNCASAAVKRDITAWCKQNEKAANQTARGYEKHYNAMLEKGNPAFLDNFSFHDCRVISCRKQGENLIIGLDYTNGFSDVEAIILEQCIVLTQETPFRNAWWLYEEIYPVAGGYEIHALLQNSRMQLIDFIVHVTGVRFKRGN